MKAIQSSRALKLAHVFTAAVLAIALSSCTKAQLIGNKQLKALKLFSILSVSPPNGPKAGGTTITLSGTGFTTGMTVSIGGIACTDVQILSPLAATCVTGSSSLAGADPVIITNGDGTVDQSKSFTYLGTLSATATRFAAGGNINSTGGAGAAKLTARTTVGALAHAAGNVTSGGAGVNKVTVRGGVIGVFTVH